MCVCVCVFLLPTLQACITACDVKRLWYDPCTNFSLLWFGVWGYGNLIYVWVFFAVWSNVSSEKVLPMQVQLSTFEGLRADGLVGASSLLRQSCAQATAGPNYPRMSVRAAVATGSPPALVSLPSFLFTSSQFSYDGIEWWKERKLKFEVLLFCSW